MEMALQLPRPLGCKEAIMGSSYFRIRKTVGIFCNSVENKGVTRIRAIPLMRASSDYSRRRPRRSAIPKTEVSAPKGFSPRPQVGTSTHKKDHDPEEKEQSDRSSSTNFPSTSQSSELRSDRKAESRTFGSISTMSSNAVKSITNVLEEGEGSGQDDDAELEDELSKDVVDEIIGRVMQERKNDYDDKVFEKRRMDDGSSSGNGGLSPTMVEDQIKKVVITENRTSAVHRKEELASVECDLSIGQHDAHYRLHEESLSKIITEMDGYTHRRLLEDLACKNFSSGNKLFVFPKIVKSDEIVEVFFNRSLSHLSNEPDVLIKGAFNDWRWKNFTEKMHKSNLQGDWWSCKIYVPKEAYKMDIVFFNGAQIYENNNQKNFSLPIEGEMDEFLFEDFLLEEKQKRLEKIASEQEENKRQAEEQRCREVEQAAMEANIAQAKLDVEKKREVCQRVMELAVESVDDLWHIEPSSSKGENKVRLYYNRSSRPLEHSLNIWIHGGYNNWIEGLSIIERLKKYEKRDGDWWYADVVVPEKILVLDWVFADGPPQQAKVYDNNNHQDFHAIITEGFSQEIYWAEEEQRVFWKLQEERRLKEEAARKKAEKVARLRAETKERTLKRFLLSQKHVVYTIPLEIRAGKLVKVLYNPSNTVLNGKQEVWFRCSFNRWTHRNGPLPPQKMAPAGNGTHLQAIVKVPLDAYTMDFVFSEREDGGVYDNKNGMDYHIPVIGGIVKEPPMHIIHIAVEMAPIAKVGGLGDVVTSLSRAVQDLGHNVDIVLPKYDFIEFNHVKDFCHHRSFCWGGTEIKVWHGRVEGLSVYFLEPQNGIFWAGCVYGRNDGERFGFFCHAALEFLLQTGFRPDILHCHDWSSAPVAWLFKELYKHNGLGNARVIFTIHNLEFGIHQIGKAMTYADRATTVSKTYSKEVSGNPALSPHLYKFHGILNGIDPDIWDPYNDNFIPVNYTSENVVEGKKAAKEALQQRLGLKKSDHPLVGVITRLTVQKGIHLIKHATWRTLDQNGQVVLLGSAPDPRIQNDFANLSNQLLSSHGDSVRLCLTYDEPLSHLIYAGADFILVPSIFEPCGLTQLVAMRYGSIPVVRKTGGLYDTVFDVDDDKERAQLLGLEPNGFSFEGADYSGLDYALNRAISVWYNDREWFNLLSKRVMEQDWSWNCPALDYIELYYAARK